jgi:predicted HTH transcriptional regulator
VDASQLRRLQLADLGDAELRELIAAGETVAERKESPPDEGMGPTIATFANSGGGWVLLGVRDDGTIAGFRVPGKAYPQDWLRGNLRVAVDPLPPFMAEARTIDGQDIVAIRVEASTQTPHLVKATGAIVVREHGGRNPIAPQARLMELLRETRAGRTANDRKDDRVPARHANARAPRSG